MQVNEILVTDSADVVDRLSSEQVTKTLTSTTPKVNVETQTEVAISDGDGAHHLSFDDEPDNRNCCRRLVREVEELKGKVSHLSGFVNELKVSRQKNIALSVYQCIYHVTYAPLRLLFPLILTQRLRKV